MRDRTTPSFGTALVAVLVGGAVASWSSSLFLGLAPYASVETWSIVTSVLGAVAVKAVLRALRYEAAFAAAAGALLAGRVASLALLQAMPDLYGGQVPFFAAFGLFSALPSLVLSALVVQLMAARAPRRLPL
jgi:uncharacterized membrane protein YeaQ/YmgE (transglycosylase-associated protein family)